MIPLVPTTQDAAAPAADGWTAALAKTLLRSWLAHYQRMADFGLVGSL